MGEYKRMSYELLMKVSRELDEEISLDELELDDDELQQLILDEALDFAQRIYAPIVFEGLGEMYPSHYTIKFEGEEPLELYTLTMEKEAFEKLIESLEGDTEL